MSRSDDGGSNSSTSSNSNGGGPSKLWEELHVRPFLCASGSNDSAFLARWSERIPSQVRCLLLRLASGNLLITQGCKCRDFWRSWVLGYAPSYHSREAYFAWTVAAHNAVNAKLGKPTWKAVRARERWDIAIRNAVAAADASTSAGSVSST